MKLNPSFPALVLFAFISCLPVKDKKPKIVVMGEASDNEWYAAKEIRKYIYLRTGELFRIVKEKQDSEGDMIVLKTNKLFGEEEFSLTTSGSESGKVLEIAGGSPRAVLYGAYELAEQMGIRFYPDGDVVPDQQVPFEIPDLSIHEKPLFSIRGIQPFHDFPEGPDWWDKQDYKAIIAQLPKLKMNFIGFHTYPENKNFRGEGNKAEPMVWIGTPDQFNADGSVKSAYPVLHFNTTDNSWGYYPRETGSYSFGSSQFFPSDKSGADYMVKTSHWPHTDTENIQIFNEFGIMQNEVFEYAHQLGIKVCIGTETSLTVPEQVRHHLQNMGIDPESDKAKMLLYKGIFERIKQTHHLDYYWFWTPEHWTWGEVNPEEVDRVENDLRIACEAAREVDVPFTLATCGWVIGPPPDRTKFDRVLPKEMPFSCINRNVGFEEIDESFLQISGRDKWAIPWMEDDPALIIPQLWAGRMRRDAADALAFGCNGLIGIHWRTRELGPNVAALAKAAWLQEWNPAVNLQVTTETLKDYTHVITGGDSTRRDLETRDFYTDWATVQFGEKYAEEIAGIFSGLDGGGKTFFGKKKLSNLPRPADWFHGPGGLLPDTTSWNMVEKSYAFLKEIEMIRSGIEGAGSLERYDFWLNQFRYLRETSHLACLLGEYRSAYRKLGLLPVAGRKNYVEEILLPIRREEMKVLGNVHHYLLQTVTTKGTLGIVTNWQQHVIPWHFEKQGDELSKILGRDLTPGELPGSAIETKIIGLLSTPLSIERGDDFRAEVLTLNIKNPEGAIFFKPPGKQKYISMPLEHSGRGVLTAIIPGIHVRYDFEYYIEMKSGGKVVKIFPATAPVINNYVTVRGTKN